MGGEGAAVDGSLCEQDAGERERERGDGERARAPSSRVAATDDGGRRTVVDRVEQVCAPTGDNRAGPCVRGVHAHTGDAHPDDRDGDRGRQRGREDEAARTSGGVGLHGS
jgi:hypothetical protein